MADGPATENGGIEVTPEMIEAGKMAFVCHSPYYESVGDGAIRVFKAMLRTWARGRPGTAITPDGNGRRDGVADAIEQLGEDDLR